MNYGDILVFGSVVYGIFMFAVYIYAIYLSYRQAQVKDAVTDLIQEQEKTNVILSDIREAIENVRKKSK